MTSTIVGNGSVRMVSGVITFGTIELQATNANTDLELTGDTTLNNTGTILLDGPLARIYANPAGATFDNVNGTIEGSGQVGINNTGFFSR